MNVSYLTNLLSEAKEAHFRWEKSTGPDPHWERWYATYIMFRKDGYDREEAYTLTATADLNGSSM